MVNNPRANARDAGDVSLIPCLGRSLGGGNGNPSQYPWLENPVDKGAWRATVQGVTESGTWVRDCAHSTVSCLLDCLLPLSSLTTVPCHCFRVMMDPCPWQRVTSLEENPELVFANEPSPPDLILRKYVGLYQALGLASSHLSHCHNYHYLPNRRVISEQNPYCWQFQSWFFWFKRAETLQFC